MAAQDGLGQQATALLTLVFLWVKQVVAGDQAGGRRAFVLADRPLSSNACAPFSGWYITWGQVNKGGGKGFMDPAYVPALAALAGSAIGGLTSFATTWLTQQTKVRAQHLVDEIVRREELYKDFIEEASRLYADAFEHDKAETSKLVNLYALVSRMRVRSAPKIIENADKVVRLIIEMYLAPNKTFRDVPKLLESDEIDPLREFSNACGEELRALRSS